MTQLLKLKNIFNKILKINKMLNKLFNQAHLNKMFNPMICKMLLRQNRNKFSINKLLKINKINQLLKKRMKFINKFKEFLSK